MFETPISLTIEGIVYVLTNEAMPGIVKIGRTSGDTVERRVAELKGAARLARSDALRWIR